MSTSTDPSVTRVDVYNRVTQSILAQLESGTVPWVRPWQSGTTPKHVALPHNAVSGRAYSGVNTILLWIAGQPYGSHGWLTFKQAQSLGGTVRKGETGTFVVYADKFIPKQEAKRAAETGDKAKAVAFLKSYYVFNRDQCDGLPAEVVGEAPSLPTIHADADALISATGAVIRLGGDKAFYQPGADYVQMPVPGAFADPLDWYRTTLHELGHWTGASNRLARTFGARFGDTHYAREELVAEMTAAFTGATLGIAPALRHADYLASWIRVLKEDSRAIVQAASMASKASDYLLATREASQTALAA